MKHLTTLALLAIATISACADTGVPTHTLALREPITYTYPLPDGATLEPYGDFTPTVYGDGITCDIYAEPGAAIADCYPGAARGLRPALIFYVVDADGEVVELLGFDGRAL